MPGKYINPVALSTWAKTVPLSYTHDNIEFEIVVLYFIVLY